jgi:hypothetical protein
MPYVVNAVGEGPNICSTPIDVKIMPVLDKRGDSPSIGVYFRIMNDEEWEKVVKDSMDLATFQEVKEEELDNEERMKYRESVKDSMTDYLDFQRYNVKEVVEKIICNSKEGITIRISEGVEKLYKQKEVMFEKTRHKNEDVTSEEQNLIRDTILGLNPNVYKDVWNKYKDMMNGTKKD